MAQFKDAKYKSGILSYNYLGKGTKGKGGGSVSIKKRDDGWYFVDKQGKVKDALGNGGKLTPTHMQNLREDGIFDAVKVNPDTGEEYAKGTEISSAPINNTGIDSSGQIGTSSTSNFSASDAPPVQPGLAESNYKLPEMSAPTSRAQKAFTPTTGDPSAKRSGPITASTENAPPTFQSDGTFTTSNFGGGRQMGIGDNTYSAVSLPKTDPQTNYPISTNPNTAFSPANEYTLPQATDTIPSDYVPSIQYDNSN